MPTLTSKQEVITFCNNMLMNETEITQHINVYLARGSFGQSEVEFELKFDPASGISIVCHAEGEGDPNVFTQCANADEVWDFIKLHSDNCVYDLRNMHRVDSVTGERLAEGIKKRKSKSIKKRKRKSIKKRKRKSIKKRKSKSLKKCKG